MDIERNGLSINVLSPAEIEKSLKLKKIIKKKPETNIFLNKINPSLDKYASGKSRKSTDIIKRVQIYKIIFTINNKNLFMLAKTHYVEVLIIILDHQY